MEGYEFQRRELMKELRLQKEELNAVYKFETFNENTGEGVRVGWLVDGPGRRVSDRMALWVGWLGGRLVVVG